MYDDITPIHASGAMIQWAALGQLPLSLDSNAFTKLTAPAITSTGDHSHDWKLRLARARSTNESTAIVTNDKRDSRGSPYRATSTPVQKGSIATTAL